jgi:hypothetical protein
MECSGYDIGGAEYPYAPGELMVLDKEQPDLKEMAHYFGESLGTRTFPWQKVDLDEKNCFSHILAGPRKRPSLKPKPTIYIGKTLRYVTRDKHELAREVFDIWSMNGTMRLFDNMDALEPFIEGLMSGCNGQVSIKEFDLINASDEDYKAEWGVLLYKGNSRMAYY